MPLYMMLGRDGPRGLELRKQNRRDHVAKLGELVDAGRLRYAGPFLNEDGESCGSLVVFEADDLAAAREQAAADPYVIAGVFETCEVIEFRQVFPK